ncbi:hypothetical protein Acr_10g0004330 [Actinidia rufa]|uniref:Uncharacterized protein n=1 Tax=Actinidia rufa TaxID=165716 RepID=A0A7J0F8K7_9ERIC|nr:hypothetical protein Acr_10g0004330 [Actinidia rufa]
MDPSPKTHPPHSSHCYYNVPWPQPRLSRRPSRSTESPVAQKKRQLAQSPTIGEESMVSSAGSEASFFGGGKMEDDLISGELPG